MGYEEELERLRKEINRLNKEIAEKIAQRVGVSKRLGDLKREHGRPVVDPARESLVYRQVRQLADRNGVDGEGLERVFQEIVRLCTEAQLEGRP